MKLKNLFVFRKSEYLRKSITLRIPEVLVREYFEHPEGWKDHHMVTFDHDLYTDVYRSEDGKLYTITNVLVLVKYIKRMKRILKKKADEDKISNG